jgi:outer membrane protein W
LKSRSAHAFTLVVVGFLLFAQPVRAQTEFRPFASFSVEQMAASKSFDATVGSSLAPFWGAGVDVVVRKHVFIDVAVSHMSRTGERVFVDNGEVFHLGIPLKVSSTPIEVTAGYRFPLRKRRVIPYAGAGFGSYSYRETSDFSAAGEDVDVRHAGFVAVAGAEFRMNRWVAVTGDAQYTRVPGILGQNGWSKDLNENDFGGIAARLRVIIGR